MSSEHDLLKLLAALAIVGAVAAAWFARRRAHAKPAATEMLTVGQLKARVESSPGRVLDVRTPADFNGEVGPPVRSTCRRRNRRRVSLNWATTVGSR